MKKKNKLSQLHQEIKTLVRDRNRKERVFLRSNPMVAASFYKKANGTCYLSTSIKGESRHRYVQKSEEKSFEKRALEWRKFSKTISQWVVLNQKLEATLRKIGRTRCDPLPGGEKS